MVSHFSTIGFPVNSQEEFLEYAALVHDLGVKMQARKDTYVFWEVGAGIELWGQMNARGEMMGMNPHFSGDAVTSVRLTGQVEDSRDTSLDGRVYAEAEPRGEGEFAYPFVFDIPDIATHAISYPVVAQVQLAAFAHELQLFVDEEAYQQAQAAEEGPSFATEFFIPSGSFAVEEGNVATSMGIFGGRVLAVNRVTNPHTGQDFYHARVKTLGGEFDVVADPELVTQEIKVGSILSGSFWLTGKLIAPPTAKGSTKKKGIVSRLFGRK